MNAFTLISRAKAAGVSFEATPAGTVHLSGKIDAVRSLATLVRAHKQELMAALRPRRLWWIRHPCGGCGTVSYTPRRALEPARARTRPGAARCLVNGVWMRFAYLSTLSALARKKPPRVLVAPPRVVSV